MFTFQKCSFYILWVNVFDRNLFFPFFFFCFQTRFEYSTNKLNNNLNFLDNILACCHLQQSFFFYFKQLQPEKLLEESGRMFINDVCEIFDKIYDFFCYFA